MKRQSSEHSLLNKINIEDVNLKAAIVYLLMVIILLLLSFGFIKK